MCMFCDQIIKKFVVGVPNAQRALIRGKEMYLLLYCPLCYDGRRVDA